MIITQPHPPTLHDRTVRWLAGIIGELQREVATLGRENKELRQQVRELEAKETPKVTAAGAGR